MEASLAIAQPDSTEPILVALGCDARTLRLVHTAFRMAQEQGRPWVAVHVDVPGWETARETDQARVWLQEARDLGAVTELVGSPIVAEGIIEAGRRHQVAQVVMGRHLPRGPLDRLEHYRAQEAIHRALAVPIIRVPLESAPDGRNQPKSWHDALGAVLAHWVILGVSAIFAAALNVALGFPGLLPTFALAVGFIAHRWGKGLASLATLEVLLVYPRLLGIGYSALRPADWTDGLFLTAVLVLVQMVVLLVDRLHFESRSMRRREAETLLIMVLSRALANCSTAEEVAAILAERLEGMFQAEAGVLVPDPEAGWRLLRGPQEAAAGPAPANLRALLGESFDRGRFEPLCLDGYSYLPLAAGGAEAVLRLRLPEGRPILPESWGLFQSLAVQAALAMERVRWVEEAQKARLESETERMRNTLLGAVSHDLRTPLAAIQGAATSLLLPEPLPEETRLDLLAMIRDESRRLARLLGDLLDLTRLQSGSIRAHKEWQPLEEVVGSAVLRVEARSGPLPIVVELPESLPLVPLDSSLMEQVLVNLLDNAMRHAPASPVALRAWAGAGTVELELADRGPGIPPGCHQRVFEKFFRLPKDNKDGGFGLGLAICVAIVDIHGGAIWAEDHPGGGARFRLTLPLQGPPVPADGLEPELANRERKP